MAVDGARRWVAASVQACIHRAGGACRQMELVRQPPTAAVHRCARTAGAASLRGSCLLAWPIQPCSLLPPTAVTGLESQLTSAGVSVPPAPSAAAVAARGANGSAAPATPEDYWSPVVHGEWLRGAECCKSMRDRAVCACMLKSGQ